MVVLMVAVTILTVFTAAALPMWSHAMKREKEEELIARGWQYAEAIRVFQQRHGRYPTRLQELMEVKPRSIRQLWKDPMTESGEWGLVFQGGPTQPGQPQGQVVAGGSGPNGGAPNGDGEEQEQRGPRAPRPGEQRTVGPIVGVRSLSKEGSIKTFFGEESYDRWQFTVERLTRAGGKSQVGFGQGRTTPEPFLPKTKWLGRPFRPGLQMPQGGNPRIPQDPSSRGGDGPIEQPNRDPSKQ